MLASSMLSMPNNKFKEEQAEALVIPQCVVAVESVTVQLPVDHQPACSW